MHTRTFWVHVVDPATDRRRTVEVTHETEDPPVTDYGPHCEAIELKAIDLASGKWPDQDWRIDPEADSSVEEVI